MLGYVELSSVYSFTSSYTSSQAVTCSYKLYVTQSEVVSAPSRSIYAAKIASVVEYTLDSARSCSVVLDYARLCSLVHIMSVIV
jgi:hypothetical protein